MTSLRGLSHQTVLLSATLTKRVQHLAGITLNDYVTVDITKDALPKVSGVKDSEMGSRRAKAKATHLSDNILKNFSILYYQQLLFSIQFASSPIQLNRQLYLSFPFL